MGFFATFWGWLNREIATYIGENTAHLAAILEPAVVTLATLYVMAWGYLQLTGRIEEPLIAGVKRIALLALILGTGLRLWLYNTVLVDTFYNAPAGLAAALVGSSDPVSTIDAIWERGGTVAANLWAHGGILSGDFGFYLAGAVVWGLVGVLCVYTMFLLAISTIALAILLALGPLFIAMALFDATRRLFSSWIAQLANYAFVTVLTVMTGSLLLQVVRSYAAQTAARGAAVLTVDALNMVLVAMLVFLVMRQVMPIAAGLASGVSLNTFATISRAAQGSVRAAMRLSGPALGAMMPAIHETARGIVRDRAHSTRTSLGDSGHSTARRFDAAIAGLGKRWRDLRR